MLQIKTLQTNMIELLPTHTGTSSSFLLTLKCYTVLYHIIKQDSEADYVMKLHSTITTEQSNPWQHPQMLSIRLQTYP